MIYNSCEFYITRLCHYNPQTLLVINMDVIVGTVTALFFLKSMLLLSTLVFHYLV